MEMLGAVWSSGLRTRPAGLRKGLRMQSQERSLEGPSSDGRELSSWGLAVD